MIPAFLLENSGGNGVWMLSQKEVSFYEYEFLKSYLYAVYSKRHQDANLKIFRCVAHNSLMHAPQQPGFVDAGSDVFPIIQSGVLEASTMWRGAMYELVVSKET